MDRAAVPVPGIAASGGTVTWTTADAGGTMVPFIRSNYFMVWFRAWWY